MTRGLKLGRLIPMLMLLATISIAMQLDTGSIEGVIMNDLGPIAKASVEASNVTSGVVFRTVSDETGHYKLTNLRAGRYSLWVRAPGYDSIWLPKIVVEPGQASHPDIHLSKSHTTSSVIPRTKVYVQN
jgi:carboxypeptidase family protein